MPWNEINHFTQPTARNPKAAARFTTIARKACTGCTVVVADILDQANNPSAKQPDVRVDDRYIKRFRRAYKGPRKVCGVHNYSDVNRFRKSGTKALVKALGCKQIWLTEAGGIFSFPGFSPSPARQLKATKYLFKVARSVKRVKRCTSTTTSAASRRASMPASWPAACRARVRRGRQAGLQAPEAAKRKHARKPHAL